MSKTARNAMSVPPENFDFSGIVTKANVTCTDGLKIMPGAFKHEHLKRVPLVFQHKRDDPANLIGHAILEYRSDSGDVYGYAFLNDTPNGKNVKSQVQHGDVDSFSIYATQVQHSGENVNYASIKEVSVVLAGANPGAKIDNVVIQHSDGYTTEIDDEYIMTFGEEFEHADKSTSDEKVKMEELDEDTIADIIDSMNEDQQLVVLSLAQQNEELVKQLEDAVEQSEEETINDIEHGGNSTMRNRIFNNNPEDATLTIEHAEEIRGKVLETIQRAGQSKSGSLFTDIKNTLEHAEAGVNYGIKDLQLLFPEAKSVTNDPTLINYPHAEWVKEVLSSVQRVPFAKIRADFWDMSGEEARARGYKKGDKKFDEVFKLLKREVSPATIYKKNKLDRDDVIDMAGFDVIAFLNKEMDMKLDEEEARAYLIGDGREIMDQFKIDETKIIPVYHDDPMYTIRYQIPFGEINYLTLPDQMLSSTENYEGSGNPTMFTTRATKIKMLTQRDKQDNRIYKTEQELIAAMGVDKIVDCPFLKTAKYTNAEGKVFNPLAIIVNMRDYKTGANALGERHSFEKFDIDYNQMVYLKETRRSGMLVKPKTAVVIEQAATAE